MKTARDHFENHKRMHEAWRAGRMSYAALDRGVKAMWIEARRDGTERGLADLVKADIRKSLDETKANAYAFLRAHGAKC